jgi:hypothetical protein
MGQVQAHGRQWNDYLPILPILAVGQRRGKLHLFCLDAGLGPPSPQQGRLGACVPLNLEGIAGQGISHGACGIGVRYQIMPAVPALLQVAHQQHAQMIMQRPSQFTFRVGALAA